MTKERNKAYSFVVRLYMKVLMRVLLVSILMVSVALLLDFLGWHSSSKNIFRGRHC